MSKIDTIYIAMSTFYRYVIDSKNNCVDLSEWYNFFLAPKGAENQHGWDDPTLDALPSRVRRRSRPTSTGKR